MTTKVVIMFLEKAYFFIFFKKKQYQMYLLKIYTFATNITYYKMKKIFILVFLLFLLVGKSFSQNVEAIAIGFYNLENLFDTINDPNLPDDEFTPTGPKLWNSKRYWHKINNMAEVISKIAVDDKIGLKGLAVLGVSEVENKRVLEDLVKAPPIKNFNYQIVHYESPDHRGIDVALLYNPKVFKVESSKQIPLIIKDNPDFKTRSQLVVVGKLGGEDFAFIVNHWPSRRGGEKKTRPYRIAAAKLAYSIIDSLKKLNPNLKIILMGDLNDDPINKSIKKYLQSKGKEDKVRNNDLFNPFEKLFKMGVGTLAYRDNWNLFDNILLTKSLLKTDKLDLQGWKYYKAKVFNPSFLKQKEGNFAGYPYRTFVGNHFMGGFSDHFPVYVILIRKTK